jgi:hypothetical protein
MIRELLPLTLAAMLGAPLAQAGEVTKTVPFALDEWIELGTTDGPVTLHRIRLAKVGGSVKSKVFRPGNSEFLQDVTIELEYTNESAKDDWEAHLDVRWLDGSGEVIDGYDDTEGLDNDTRKDDATVTLSTLKYGLARAKKLQIDIDFYED